MGNQSLTHDQLRKLLEMARARRERDWLMILVAYNHGLRASEVVSIVADDVRDGFLTVRRLKGSLKTEQPLVCHSDPLFDEASTLSALARNQCGNQRLFPRTRQRFWQIFREHAKAAGIPRRLSHPHIAKHTLAMQMIGTAGIENTRQYLGHRSISSTGAYLKVSDKEASEAAKRALGGL